MALNRVVFRDFGQPRYLRAVLREQGKRVKKSLGQHYLIDKNILRKLAVLMTEAAAQPGATNGGGGLEHVNRAARLRNRAEWDGVIIELGAGLGTLTQCLLEQQRRVIAVELERASLAILRANINRDVVALADTVRALKCAEPPALLLLEQDILKCDWKTLLELPDDLPHTLRQDNDLRKELDKNALIKDNLTKTGVSHGKSALEGLASGTEPNYANNGSSPSPIRSASRGSSSEEAGVFGGESGSLGKTNGSGERSGVIFVGNLPYNSAVRVILHLLEICGGVTKKMVFMVQREVSENLTAHPSSTSGAGSKLGTYGVATLLVGWHGKVRRQFSVAGTCFYPEPRVLSEVITIEPYGVESYSVESVGGQRKQVGGPSGVSYSEPSGISDDSPSGIFSGDGDASQYDRSAIYPIFKYIVKAAFSHRRKTIVNAFTFYEKNVVSRSKRASVPRSRLSDSGGSEESGGIEGLLRSGADLSGGTEETEELLRSGADLSGGTEETEGLLKSGADYSGAGFAINTELLREALTELKISHRERSEALGMKDYINLTQCVAKRL